MRGHAIGTFETRHRRARVKWKHIKSNMRCVDIRSCTRARREKRDSNYFTYKFMKYARSRVLRLKRITIADAAAAVRATHLHCHWKQRREVDDAAAVVAAAAAATAAVVVVAVAARVVVVIGSGNIYPPNDAAEPDRVAALPFHQHVLVGVVEHSRAAAAWLQQHYANQSMMAATTALDSDAVHDEYDDKQMHDCRRHLASGNSHNAMWSVSYATYHHHHHHSPSCFVGIFLKHYKCVYQHRR